MSSYQGRERLLPGIMDFAPYQSSPPEQSRVASPDYRLSSPRRSLDAAKGPISPAVAQSSPPLQHPQPQRAWTGLASRGGPWTAGIAGFTNSTNVPSAAEISEFDTSLGLRLDYEACLAYLAVPPVGAVFLLILERNSDYVRLVGRGSTCVLY